MAIRQVSWDDTSGRMTPTEPPIRFAVKAADQVLNNTVAYVSAGTSLPVEAGAVYQVEAFIDYLATAVADISIGWTYPAGSTMGWAPNGLPFNSTSSAGSITRLRNAISAVATIGGNGLVAANRSVALPVGLLTAGGAGRFDLRWAQANAEATDSTMYAGSYLKLTRVT